MVQRTNYTWKLFIADYWLLLKGRRTYFSFLTILMFASNLAPFAMAYFLGSIVDFFTFYNGGSLQEFYLYVALIAVTGALQVWLRFFSKVRIQNIAAKIRKEIRLTVISKMLSADLDWHAKEDTGSKIHKINTGGEAVYKGIKDFSNQGLTIISGLVGGLVLFIFIDYRYVLFALIYVTIYFLGEAYFNRRISYWQDEYNKAKEKASGKMQESASNISTVKALGLKESLSKNAELYEDEYYKAWEKQRNISRLKFQTLKIFSAIIYAIFILILGFDLITGLITVGLIIVYASYFGRIKSSMSEFTNNISEFITEKSGIGRFMTLYKVSVEDDANKKFPGDWKEIRFENVTLKYKEKKALDNASFSIRKGETLGIIGESGSGKTSISKVLLKLHKPLKGKIIVGDIDIRDISDAEITKNISVVPQESELFNASLHENVTIYSTDKDMNAFKLASKVALLESVIKKLPDKEKTLVGEKGHSLSGGEKQRIGIARALYKDSDILILDEATSALDAKTEMLVMDNLDKALKGKTKIIISHKISSLKKADRIIKLSRGKIVAEGKYEDITKSKAK